MRSFIGITAHFILDWSLKTAMLACKRVKGRHTAENILDHFEEIKTVYNLNNKITHIVTDNASNMIAAFSKKSSDTSDSDSDSDTEDNTLDTSEDNTSDLCNYLPEHESCFCHTTQLVIKDALLSCTQLNNAISKCNNIASRVHKSTLISEQLETERRILSANKTRWHSNIMCVRSVLRVSKDKLDQLDIGVKLTTIDRNILEDFLVVMEPFEEVTKRIQGDQVVTGSMVIPCIRSLQHHLDTVDSKFNKKLVQGLKDSMAKRLTPYEEKSAYRRASVLDPRFKAQWCSSADEQDQVKSDILSILSTATHQEPQPTPESATSSPPRKKSRLFGFMAKPTTQPTRDTTDLQELNSYLSESPIEDTDDPLDHWRSTQHKFPKLAKLAQRYLSLPASSAAVERIFSVGGKLFRPDRARLSDKNFEMQMYNKCNFAYL